MGAFGEVLVVDWGLAKDLADGSFEIVPDELPESVAGTLAGNVVGTPYYMATEQARGEIESLDARSDVFALGAILREILHLLPTASGGSALGIVDKVGTGRCDPVPGAGRGKNRPWEKKVSASLQGITTRATAFAPTGRYQTVAELQTDLRSYQSGLATDAEGASFAKHLPLFFRRYRKRGKVNLRSVERPRIAHLMGSRLLPDGSRRWADSSRGTWASPSGLSVGAAPG